MNDPFDDEPLNPHFKRSLPLMRRYPDLFGPGPWPLEDDPLGYGFACGDGWLPLIEALLEDLREIARRERVPVVVRQVGQKMGHLDVRLRSSSKTAWSAAQEAILASCDVCEDCGTASRIRAIGSRYTSRCDVCEARRAARLA